MKKSLLSLIILVITLGCFSVSASAATTITPDVSNASTSIYYLLDGQYEITIPSSAIITHNNSFDITAEYIHLLSNKSVVITVSDNSFDSEGNFKMYGSGSASLLCDLLVGPSDGVKTAITRTNASNTPVVSFTCDNADTHGTVQIIPQIGKTSSAGVYDGTINFDIALVEVSSDN